VDDQPPAPPARFQPPATSMQYSVSHHKKASIKRFVLQQTNRANQMRVINRSHVRLSA
jgi:hypothetical protein